MLLEQRLRKGTESLALWITIVEAIFRKRGQARQETIDTWLTGTTPPQWKEKYKEEP